MRDYNFIYIDEEILVDFFTENVRFVRFGYQVKIIVFGELISYIFRTVLLPLVKFRYGCNHVIFYSLLG